MTWLILILVLLAMAAVVAIMARALGRGWATWAFLAAWGVSVLAALFMSLVGLCDDAAGTCTDPERMALYQGALPSLIVLGVAGVALLIPHPIARGIAFPALTVIGAVLVALRMWDDEQQFVALVILAFVVAGVVREALTRTGVRAGARTSAG